MMFALMHGAALSQRSLRPVDAMHKIGGAVGANPATLVRPIAAARGELVHLQVALARGSEPQQLTTSGTAQIDARTRMIVRRMAAAAAEEEGTRTGRRRCASSPPPASG